MNMMNQLILEGNVEDVKSTELPDSAVTSIVVSTRRMYRTESGEDMESVSYIDVDLWGKLGEFARSLEKGRGLRIVGHLKQNRWEADGKEFSKVVVVAEHIEVKP